MGLGRQGGAQLPAEDQVLGVQRTQAPGVPARRRDARQQPTPSDELDGDTGHRRPGPDRRTHGLTRRQLHEVVEDVPQRHHPGGHGPAQGTHGTGEDDLQLGVGAFDRSFRCPQREGAVPREVRRDEGGVGEGIGEHGGG